MISVYTNQAVKNGNTYMLFGEDEDNFKYQLKKYNIPFNLVKFYPYSEMNLEKSPETVVLALGSRAATFYGCKKVSGDNKILEESNIYLSYNLDTIDINYKFKMHFEQTIRKIAIKLGYTKTFSYKPNVRLVLTLETFKELKEKLAKVKSNEPVSVDLETTTFDYWRPETHIMSIGICFDDNECWAIPVVHPDSPWREQGDKVFKTLAPYLENLFIVGDNWKYDFKWIKAKYGIEVNFKADGMLMHYSLNENELQGLKYRATKYCDAPKYDNIKWPDYDCTKHDIQEVVNKYFQINLQDLLYYQALDGFYSRHCYKIIKPKLKAEPKSLKIYYYLLQGGSKLYSEIESTGIHMDKFQIKETIEKVQDIIEDTINKMGKFIPEGWEDRNLTKSQLKKGFNWNSPKQLGLLLFQEDGLNFPVKEYTPKGAPSTAESTLIELSKDIDHPLMDLLMEYRKYCKYMSTYLLPWLYGMDNNQRFHPSFKLSGTVTGRLSGNLQQIPRDFMIRNLIGGREGYTFVELDLSQIELRVAAMIAQETSMLIAFSEGKDIHSNTATLISGKRIEDITKDERKKAKPTNFGFLYGMGWRKFKIYAYEKYGVEFTDQESKQFRDRFFEGYNKLLPWHDRTRRIIHKLGYIMSPIGRKRRLPEIWSNDNKKIAACEREAINSPVQSTGSDIMLSAFIWIYDKLEKERPYWRTFMNPVGGVHDSMFWEIRNKEAYNMAKWLKKEIEDPTRLIKWFGWTPELKLVADVKMGTHYGNAKEINFD